MAKKRALSSLAAARRRSPFLDVGGAERELPLLPTRRLSLALRAGGVLPRFDRENALLRASLTLGSDGAPRRDGEGDRDRPARVFISFLFLKVQLSPFPCKKMDTARSVKIELKYSAHNYHFIRNS